MGFSVKQFSALTFLNCHDKTKALYGEFGGYPMTAVQEPGDKLLAVCIFANAPERLGQFAETGIQQWAQQQSGISSAEYENRRITLKFSTARPNCEEYIEGLLRSLTEMLKNNDFTTCCNGCGADVYGGYYLIENLGAYYCSSCASAAESMLEEQKQEKAAMRANPIGILAGALAGGLTMALLTFILWQMDFIAAASGLAAALVMYACVKKWGGRLPIWGVVLCLAVMLGSTVFSLRYAVAFKLRGSIQEAAATLDVTQEGLDDAKAVLAECTDEEIYELTEGRTRSEIMENIRVSEEALSVTEGHETTMECYKDLSELLDMDLLKDWKKNYYKGLIYLLLIGMLISTCMMIALYSETNGHYKMVWLG